MLPAPGEIKRIVILKGRKSAFYFSNNILNRRGKYNLNDILLKLMNLTIPLQKPRFIAEDCIKHYR
jgi:hypothetical protein